MFDRFFDATRAQYIARPDSAANELVFRHPNTTIPRGAKLTVRSDEEAAFFREGRVVGALKPGAYVLDTQNIPFLGSLVNVVTGGNHYLAELFFVRTAETPLGIGESELGSFVDVNSRNLLRVLFDARVTVSVSDGIALITQLGGQSSDSGGNAERIVSARLRNALKSHVATEAQRLPIYQIVSNAGSDQFGATVVERVAAEFRSVGIRFGRFLDLHLKLDAESTELLRAYQMREADLVIDAKGAQVAADPGFVTYNAVKGSRSVAEGLGDGLSRGLSGPIIGMGLGGIGMGGVLPGAGIGGAPRGPSPLEAARGLESAHPPRSPDRFIIAGPNGNEGPFSARQVALWVLASGRPAEGVKVRYEKDPEDLWSSADAEPSIAQELNRRRGTAGQPRGGSRPAPSPFETALEQAFSDKRITADEMALLSALAMTSGLAPNDAAARAFIIQRATAAGCTVDAASSITFEYWDGRSQESSLLAAAVAARVIASPDGMHLVWTAALREWTDARSVPEIAALLASPPTPPPSPPPPPARL